MDAVILVLGLINAGTHAGQVAPRQLLHNYLTLGEKARGLLLYRKIDNTQSKHIHLYYVLAQSANLF